MTIEVLALEYPDRIAECHAVRRRVFVDEQAVRVAEELDGLDPGCAHFLALLDERPVGTARLRASDLGTAKAERVAVLADARRAGVGSAIMGALEAAARRKGHREVVLGAQLRAIAFYESLGYRAFGEEYEDARIPHRWMRKPL
jgi:predicted GNAT family N-acyltransferase